MIWKRCGYCGQRIAEGTRCNCKASMRALNHSGDRAGTRALYQTHKWNQARVACLQRYDFVDLYALYHDGRVVPADRVHHIIPAETDPRRFYDPRNHIPVSDESHRAIHERMRQGFVQNVQRELRSYLSRYPEGLEKV